MLKVMNNDGLGDVTYSLLNLLYASRHYSEGKTVCKGSRITNKTWLQWM